MWTWRSGLSEIRSFFSQNWQLGHFKQSWHTAVYFLVAGLSRTTQFHWRSRRPTVGSYAGVSCQLRGLALRNSFAKSEPCAGRVSRFVCKIISEFIGITIIANNYISASDCFLETGFLGTNSRTVSYTSSERLVWAIIGTPWNSNTANAFLGILDFLLCGQLRQSLRTHSFTFTAQSTSGKSGGRRPWELRTSYTVLRSLALFPLNLPGMELVKS